MRLANGKVLKTCGKVYLNVKFGKFRYFGPFHVLDYSVPLILGMEFLSSTKPDVDFYHKTVVVHKRKCKYELPTVELMSGK